MSDWIHTFTGRKVDPVNLRVCDIDIRDIAHALALTNRFTGHTPEPYSVAQHSVIVSHICDPKDALWGLLHDAPEAYLADISRPAKAGMRAAGCEHFDTVDYAAMMVICRAFDLPFKEPASVKHADELILASEAHAFFRHHPLYMEWHHRPENGFPLLECPIEPWHWRKAEIEFLSRFRALYDGAAT